MAATDQARDQTLAHLRLVAGFPGFWELRALRRLDGNRMEARGSFFIIATATADSLIYDRLEQAVDWADEQDHNGAELFLGMNPRECEAKGKDAVPIVTACYVDLDLPEGETPESALDQLTDSERPLPSFVVHSGYGLHAVYLLREPAGDKCTWKKVQRGLVHAFADLGADRAVAPDESRVLRLVPYPNRKQWPEGVPTSILYQSESRYELAELADAFRIEGTAFSRNEILSFVPVPHVSDGAGDEGGELPAEDEMQRLVDRAERTRAILELWIRRNMKPGLHYGIIPIDGHEASKPTLLKPGAELVAQLYGWRFHFVADMDSLQMYGPSMAGTFAYICYVIDRQGRAVGQGRGVAELREMGMNNANKTVKMAEKRAQVDAILRCASLSQWFTQDLEEPLFVAPESTPAPEQSLSSTPSNGADHQPFRRGDRCTPAQCQDIRMWLKMTGRTEGEILDFYKITRLEELKAALAEQVIRRLMEIRRAPR